MARRRIARRFAIRELFRWVDKKGPENRTAPINFAGNSQTYRIYNCSDESAVVTGSGHCEDKLERRSPMYYPASEINYAEPDSAKMCGDGRMEKLNHGPVSPQLRAAYVKFVDGAHTKWHYHRGEQWLMPTEGIGFVEFRGLPLLQIGTGDRVFIPVGVWHRHGARNGHSMTHIAVTSGDTVWDETECREQWNAAPDVS